MKGYTCWAIGFACGRLTKGILSDEKAIMPVSVYAKGFHGIEEEVYLSLCSVVGEHGIEKVLLQKLTDTEREKLQYSAKSLSEVIQGIKF